MTSISDAAILAPWATGEGTLEDNPLSVVDRIDLPTPPAFEKAPRARSATVGLDQSTSAGPSSKALETGVLGGTKRRKIDQSKFESTHRAPMMAGALKQEELLVHSSDERLQHISSDAQSDSTEQRGSSFINRIAAMSSAISGRVYECGPALRFSVDATSGMARATTLRMCNGTVPSPVFMPVGTQGTVKGVSPDDLEDPALDVRIALGNTYHLGTRPGEDRMKRLGGLHRLMGLHGGRCLLTDSGGFQMVSLLHLAEITEKGVEFRSPMDGSEMLLTPEKSMRIQNAIGADILMALDDVVDSKTVDGPRFVEACARTLRWIDRCISAHARTDDQNLFGIIQGGLDTRPGGLRDDSLRGMMLRDACLPGYAIGGLAGGEDKRFFWRVVAQCCAALPPWKPRYLMGVGFPLDLVVCVGLGVDMFDCVFPTRTARFGSALVPGGQLRLRAGKSKTKTRTKTREVKVSDGKVLAETGGDGLPQSAAEDTRPIDETCPCPACRRGQQGFTSRARLHALSRGPDPATAAQLLTLHNICYMLRLSRAMRRAVVLDQYAAFTEHFMLEYFPSVAEEGATAVPLWAREALTAAGIAGEGREWMLASGGDAEVPQVDAGRQSVETSSTGIDRGKEDQFAAAIPAVGLEARFEGSSLDWGLGPEGDIGLGWEHPSLKVSWPAETRS